MTSPLLIATFNPGKARELLALLSVSASGAGAAGAGVAGAGVAGAGVAGAATPRATSPRAGTPGAAPRIVTLADCGIDEPYAERGATYEENARGKAEHYARLANLTAIADDSGLEVDALGGAPGPLSARYGGPGLDDAGRCQRLLEELRDVPEEKWSARYVAVVAIARPGGAVRLFRGECAGRIASAPRGAGGFGYDPIFFYPPFGATFGQITDDRKHEVSHRGAAFRSLSAFLASDDGRRFVA